MRKYGYFAPECRPHVVTEWGIARLRGKSAKQRYE
jgi:acyl-CoA hydrolase